MASTQTLSPKGDQLYSKCLEISSTSTGPNSDIFSQADLIAMDIGSDLAELVALCQELSNANLFQILTIDREPCYRCRAREAAAKISVLGDKEFLVYTTIEATGTTGIWSKTLAAKTNVHQAVMTKALKVLEGKGYVKQIKSVKFPKRKIYMLKELHPAEEVTGGPWFSDGEMDVDFIASIGSLVEEYVKEKSWREGPRLKPTTTAPNIKHENNTANADANPMEIDIQLDPRFHGLATSRRGRPLLPHPPGYSGYPTTSDILTWIDSMGIIQDKDITHLDMSNLLDVLVYDGKLERIARRSLPPRPSSTAVTHPSLSPDASSSDNDSDAVLPTRRARPRGKQKATTSAGLAPAELPPSDPEFEDMFRWVRRPDGEDGGVLGLGPGNGFSEAPCARCPVFRLCEEGGPVDARSCGYFEGWLAL